MPASFEVSSRSSPHKGVEREAAQAQTHGRMDSFLDEKDGVSVPASVVLRDKVVAMEEKKAKRRSRFREEFGDEV